MTDIYFQKSHSDVKKVTLQEGESVLGGLLRNGIDVPYGCKNGVCQSCMMKTVESKVPAEAQVGLRATQKQQGYFLSCCCKPKDTIVVRLDNDLKKETTEVVDVRKLTDDVLRLRLKKVICYHSGQYMTLWRDDNTARTFSLVSHPTQDDFIEFHIRVYEKGGFSEWAMNNLKVGDKLEIQGPMGNCYYVKDDIHQPLFLAGIGTGFAPLYGIARDALVQGHQGDIHFLIGAANEQGLYMKETIEAFSRQYPQVKIYYSNASGMGDEIQQDIYKYSQAIMPDFTGVRVFLCGSDNLVKTLRKQAFLAGANMGDIHSDTFLRFYAT